MNEIESFENVSCNKLIQINERQFSTQLIAVMCQPSFMEANILTHILLILHCDDETSAVKY